jgi:hypothetical protein
MNTEQPCTQYHLPRYVQYILRDEAFSTAELEIYFNDLYHLFLRTLTTMVHEPELTAEQEQRMQHMLSELLQAKRILSNPAK